jgi:holo-[acyl-carrier protein] synthase
VIPPGAHGIVGIGVDVVDIDRIERMLDRHGERALRRLLTGGERAYCSRSANPAQHVAARVAAKEAAYKALQVDPEAASVWWLDLEVQTEANGGPSLHMHRLAAEAARRLGVSHSFLSLSHSGTTAVAFVTLVR